MRYPTYDDAAAVAPLAMTAEQKQARTSMRIQQPRNHAHFAARLLAGVASGPAGCWIWTGGTRKGYGRITIATGYTARVHRAAFTYFIGVVPDGLQLDHTCHNQDLNCPGGVKCLHRRCLNPLHLEPVTALVNKRRALRLSDDECSNGHYRGPGSTYVERNGRSWSRKCRECNRESTRRYRARRAEASGSAA